MRLNLVEVGVEAKQISMFFSQALLFHCNSWYRMLDVFAAGRYIPNYDLPRMGLDG